MGNAERYIVVGQNGSPYSIKLRAVMRYRRLPFDWVLRTQRNMAEFADVKPLLMPMIRFPGEQQWRVDSTPIIDALEQHYPGQRSVIPDSPSYAFLAYLIEDFADEWLTKAMFHYRWAYDADIKYASFWIADDFFPDEKGEARAAAAKSFADRQIERMPLVGCTPENTPVIEETYRRTLKLLESHVGLHDYLFGTRPSVADFGLFGQLKTLATDPTPLAIMRGQAQRTESWLRQLDDASGVEGVWYSEEEVLPNATVGLLRLIADTHLPFLVANATAAQRGDDKLEIELLGQSYTQAPFGYQVKCLAVLRERFAALDEASLKKITPLLKETACLHYFVK
jgi:glutathione S-transferase